MKMSDTSACKAELPKFQVPKSVVTSEMLPPKCYEIRYWRHIRDVISSTGPHGMMYVTIVICYSRSQAAQALYQITFGLDSCL